MKHHLAKISHGIWLPDDNADDFLSDEGPYEPERLYLFHATPLALNFHVIKNKKEMKLSIPISNWIMDATSDSMLLPTVFKTYHKNVIGLPFLVSSDFDYVFDDYNQKFYFVSR